eukprot:TRINITY_DN488_c0_g2_i1.p2 TRINITY_DN488_c0_g2~~TRINITY_DN488_c0_g2_i1.p2  ORF type:complete len:236 (+),score=37.77 TRINITY_DN488_c0_g2_i1:164-871(+)
MTEGIPESSSPPGDFPPVSPVRSSLRTMSRDGSQSPSQASGRRVTFGSSSSGALTSITESLTIDFDCCDEAGYARAIPVQPRVGLADVAEHWHVLVPQYSIDAARQRADYLVAMVPQSLRVDAGVRPTGADAVLQRQYGVSPLLDHAVGSVRTAWHRYSHFYELHCYYAPRLPKDVAAALDEAFPKKTWSRTVRDPNILEQRRGRLGCYVPALVKAVLRHLPEGDWATLACFLEL